MDKIIISLILVAAAGLLVRRVIKALSAEDACCSGCSGCDSKKNKSKTNCGGFFEER